MAIDLFVLTTLQSCISLLGTLDISLNILSKTCYPTLEQHIPVLKNIKKDLELIYALKYVKLSFDIDKES